MIDHEIFSLLQTYSLPLPTHCKQLSGGANNRVDHLIFSNAAPLVLKRYFQHSQDLRQRLVSEYSFLQYAWDIGLRCIPQPIACDLKTNSALYSYVPGRQINASDLSEDLIRQVTHFFYALNQSKDRGKTLPIASEACFSIQEHLSVVENRIHRLASLHQSDLDQFLREELLPSWEKIKKKIDPSMDCPFEDRCISPSDFGFHNALLKQDGRLVFIDFEYAGWDDPAKTVSDFFCQPRIPVSTVFFNTVLNHFLFHCQKINEAKRRQQMLFPIYQIKWCCILLNVFSSVGQSRRLFAQIDEPKAAQLKKARQILNHLEDFPWHT